MAQTPSTSLVLETVSGPRKEATREPGERDAFHSTYYALLGVPRNATPDQLAQAYRAYVARIHPDKCFHDARAHAVAQEKLKTVNVAMRILRDPVQRARYDAELARSPLTARLGHTL